MKKRGDILEEAQVLAGTTVDELEQVVDRVQKNIENAAIPVRKHVFKRFPVAFSLLAAFGFTATSLGMELVLLKYQLLTTRPLLLLILGILILAFTGTLYKKLG